MSQTYTNTNNGSDNTNLNQISRKGGQGQGGPGGRGPGDCSNGCGSNLIAKCSFKGKMKDSRISELTITEIGHQATQYKKIIDNLPIICEDKNYQSIDGVIWNRIDLVEADFTPIYLDVNL